MTDLPDTDTLKGLHDKLGGVTVPDLMHGDNLAITLCTAYDNPDQDTDDETGWTPDAIAGQEAVLAAIRAHYDPAIARVIEQDARIARLTEALRLHQAWSDSEDAGPDYGAQTRDTHPDGERIWRQWWDGNLDLCARAQEATRAALEDGQ